MTTPTNATDNSITVRAHQGETLDAMAYRVLGNTSGHVEATLNANPGLARWAAALPEGHPVRLVKATQTQKPLTYLWT